MGVSISQVRKLGYLKLLSIYNEVDNGETGVEVLTRAVKRGVETFKGVDIPSFSMLKYYNSIRDLPKEEVGGMLEIMLLSAQDIDIVSPERENKQLFKYYWAQMWRFFCDALPMYTEYKDSLSSLGLILPVFLSAVEAEDKVAHKIMSACEFYNLRRDAAFELSRYDFNDNDLTLMDVRELCDFFNLVESWFCVTQRFSSKADDLLNALVILDREDFVSKLLRGEGLIA